VPSSGNNELPENISQADAYHCDVLSCVVIVPRLGIRGAVRRSAADGKARLASYECLMAGGCQAQCRRYSSALSVLVQITHIYRP